MEYSFSEAVNSLIPSCDPAYYVISDFAKSGTRYRLAEVLKAANFFTTSTK